MPNPGLPPITIRHPGQLFIGGKWETPSSASTFDVITPATEETFFSVAQAQDVDVNRAVASARQAFDQGPWPRMSHAERAGYMRRISEGLRTRMGELSQIQTNQVGMIHSLSQVFMSGIPAMFEYYASLADTYPFEERHRPVAGKVGLLIREPVGVVAAIIPWNAPLFTMSVKIAPALLSGCTLVVKLAPEAPIDGYVLAEVIEEIGLPSGVINLITADRAVSELLVRHSGVDKVSFTGSTAAGKRIASICGERIARCTLELGGKSAAVVMDDYDVEEVAKAIAASSCANTTQVCSALTRIIVTKQKHDALTDAFSAAFKAIKVGDPYDAASQIGPLAMRRQRDRVEHYIYKGCEEGATLATGGRRPRHLDRGFFIEPTVFSNVDHRSTIAREEIFGPVISIIPADDEARAVEIANDSRFGLNSTVFTNDIDKAYATARVLRAGTVGHNAFRSDFGIAFGGFKESGIGREGGREGLLPFLEAKTVVLDGEPHSPHGIP
jgi:acyl-CoA reductase-like NAD-dependent aldehyde dehydrogenase